MAITGFPTDTQTLPLLPPGSTQDQQTQIINDIIQRLNTVNGEVEGILLNNTFKIVDTHEGSMLINSPGGALSYSVTNTYNHNLGYTPTVMAFGALGLTPTSGFSRPIAHGAILIPQVSAADNFVGNALWSVDTNSTTLNVSADFPTQTVAASYNGNYVNFKVYLFRETAN